MFFKSRSISKILHNHFSPARIFPPFPEIKLSTNPISSLKVARCKDLQLDQAIQRDKRYKLCFRVVKEVLNEPRQIIPLRYLENRRERLRLDVKAETFVTQNPGLFDVYYDRIKPKTVPVKFLRVSDRLRKFLEEEKKIIAENEAHIVEKLCKMLMMAKNKVISADKLNYLKREFGFPNDFLVNLAPRYPNYFRLIGRPGEDKRFIALVDWNPGFAKSVIERRAEEESKVMGIRVRPNFNYNLPPGLFLRKEMREWVRDWLEQDYISPFADASQIEQSSPAMEKRTVGVLHELLSLSVLKRMQVPLIGKLRDEYRLSHEFSNAFIRHLGIFYVSMKGNIKTAMLREAYDRDGNLIDKDPLLDVKVKFVQLLEAGWRERAEQLKSRGVSAMGSCSMVLKSCESD